jgi:hypothetical protein
MTPVDWLEKDYDDLFHEDNKVCQRPDAFAPELEYYAYPRPWVAGVTGSGGGTPLFSLKKDDAHYHEMYYRPVVFD